MHDVGASTAMCRASELTVALVDARARLLRVFRLPTCTTSQN